MPITELTEYLDAAKTLLDLIKGVKNALPLAPEQEQRTQEEIDRAERALRAAEAQLAKELDYHLCQCTFPPQIMLLTGRHPNQGMEIFRCPKCENQEPSEYDIRQHELVGEYNRSGGGRVI